MTEAKDGGYALAGVTLVTLELLVNLPGALGQ